MVDQDLLVASNFDNFSVTKYRRYVIKLHVDIPETQQQASQILITSPPSDHPRYKNYTYFEDAPGRFCVGYNVDTIDNTTFMPVYSSKSSKNRSLLNLEFTQEYRSYLQKKCGRYYVLSCQSKTQQLLDFVETLSPQNLQSRLK